MNPPAIDMPEPTTAATWRRCAAAVYDLLPLLALWFACGVLAQAVTLGSLDTHRLDHKLLLQALLLLVSATYFVVSWRRGGQTIGMRAWRLRVVGDDTAALTWQQAVLRFCVAVISVLAAGIGLLWMFVDPQRRCWHDIAAGTRVVRLPKV